jgi:cell division protein FtsB
MENVVKNGRERLLELRRKLARTGIGVLLCVGAGTLVCLVAYYVVFSANNGLLVYEQKRRESRDLDRQIKALQQQNAAMEQEVKALKTDPKTIEKEARERLRYAKPGEIIYTLPTGPASRPEKK